jgi:hypothetical protein
MFIDTVRSLILLCPPSIGTYWCLQCQPADSHRMAQCSKHLWALDCLHIWVWS